MKSEDMNIKDETAETIDKNEAESVNEEPELMDEELKQIAGGMMRQAAGHTYIKTAE